MKIAIGKENTQEMTVYNDTSFLKKEKKEKTTLVKNDLDIKQDRLNELKTRLETRFMTIIMENGRCESYCPLEIELKETYGIIFVDGQNSCCIHFEYLKTNDNMITMDVCHICQSHTGKGQRVGLLELYQIIKCLI